jgi:DNA-binding response OmpR family regulator
MMEAGMNDYVWKPMHASDLLSKMNTLIALDGMRGRADA